MLFAQSNMNTATQHRYVKHTLAIMPSDYCCWEWILTYKSVSKNLVA